MRLLLDTHAWLWNFGAPTSLSPAARSALIDPANHLHLSPISVWEAILLAQKGRIVVDRDPLVWVREAVAAVPAVQVPLSYDIAMRSRDLPGYTNPDPADRFLVATALVHGLTIVTVDDSMRAWPGVPTLW